jgi:aryl-phospho-beta-D-glucosidase BglC (GH1 family)
MRRALLEILGQEKYDYLSDQFLGYFFTREDTKFLASLGLNYVRIPINHTMRKTSDQRKWLQAG